MTTTNSRDTRATATLTDDNKRWIWLRESEGRHHIARSNYEPTKANGLVGQHKRLVKRSLITRDDEALAKLLGAKLKERPARKVERVSSLFDEAPATNTDSLFEEAGQKGFLQKLAEMNDAESFADALALLYARDGRGPFDLYTLFCEVGWAEGHRYCQKRSFILGTAHKGFLAHPENGWREKNETYWKHRKFTGSMIDEQITNAIYILRQGPEEEKVDVDDLFG